MASSPLLIHRSDIHLVREPPLTLRMQIPIGLGDILGPQPRLVRNILEPLLRSGDIDDPVNDSVRNVHSLGRKLLGEGDAHGAESPFGSREGGHLRVGLDGGGGAGEDEGRGVSGRGVVLGVLEKKGEGGLGEDESAFAVVSCQHKVFCSYISIAVKHIRGRTYTVVDQPLSRSSTVISRNGFLTNPPDAL